MASGIYNQWKTELMNKIYDLGSGGDTIRGPLYNNTHAFNADDTGYTATNEITGTGYTAKGEALTSQTVTQDNTDDEGVFDAANLSWTSASFTAYHCVLFSDTPTSPADPLICSIDFGGAQTVTSGTFTIQWAAEGIINIT